MTIITGGLGTGKSFVAEAMAALNKNSEVFEVASVTEAAEAYKKAKTKGNNPIFVCNSCIFNAGELFSQLKMVANAESPAFCIHITRGYV